MEKVLFKNETDVIEAEITQVTPHLIQLVTDAAVNTSGFDLVAEIPDFSKPTPSIKQEIYGEYHGYTTLYRKLEGGFILSDDGSVYVEPEPAPEPEPYEPTLEEIQEAKVAEMNAAQQAAISAGIDIELTDGRVEHFTLTDHDQTSLMGLQTQVAAGMEQIPWHTADESEPCKFYSAKDMTIITAAAMQAVTWHVTYFRDLRIYIRSLRDKESVDAVYYGMPLPEEFQSEPLKAMLTAQAA